MSRFLESLDLPTTIFRDQSLIVVGTEGGIDGSFVLHSLLAEFRRLSGDGKVLLILNHQTTGHWTALSGKLGWNLQQVKDQGRLGIIDTLKTRYELLMNPSTENSNLLINPENNCLELDRLYEKCVQEVTKLCPSNQNNPTDKPKLLIIIEDLTNVLHTIPDTLDTTKNVLEFLRKLRFLRSELDVCIATLVNSNGNKGTKFANLLTQVLPSLVFHVKPLQTGFSSKFNGAIGVRMLEKVFKDEFSPLARPDLKEYHFKLEDRGVKFLPL